MTNKLLKRLNRSTGITHNQIAFYFLGISASCIAYYVVDLFNMSPPDYLSAFIVSFSTALIYLLIGSRWEIDNLRKRLKK